MTPSARLRLPNVYTARVEARLEKPHREEGREIAAARPACGCADGDAVDHHLHSPAAGHVCACVARRQHPAEVVDAAADRLPLCGGVDRAERRGGGAVRTRDRPRAEQRGVAVRVIRIGGEREHAVSLVRQRVGEQQVPPAAPRVVRVRRVCARDVRAGTRDHDGIPDKDLLAARFALNRGSQDAHPRYASVIERPSRDRNRPGNASRAIHGRVYRPERRRRRRHRRGRRRRRRLHGERPQLAASRHTGHGFSDDTPVVGARLKVGHREALVVRGIHARSELAAGEGKRRVRVRTEIHVVHVRPDPRAPLEGDGAGGDIRCPVGWCGEPRRIRRQRDQRLRLVGKAKARDVPMSLGHLGRRRKSEPRGVTPVSAPAAPADRESAAAPGS